MSRLLEKITLCAVDCINPHLAARAISESTRLCRFGRSVLISDSDFEGNFELHKIDKIKSKEEYSDFIISKLAGYIETDFALIIQWDGYVVDATQWSDDFLVYDYIGASWPWIEDNMSVGNGGFSLRSKKLLRAMSAESFSFDPDINEDVLICRVNRQMLERDFGIIFAPREIAERFSYEKSLPSGPTFGFHGFHNMWRYIGDPDMAKILSHIDRSFLSSKELIELMIQYYLLGKFKMFGKIYHLVRQANRPDDLARKLSEILEGNGSLLTQVLAAGDKIGDRYAEVGF